MSADNPPRRALVLKPGEGRSYFMGGRIAAVFKADHGETAANPP